MSAQIDVLAVMDRLEDYYRRHEVLIGPVDDAYSVEHKAARLAVAELIDKADTAATVLSNLIAAGQVDAGYSGHVTDLTAALASCGGAK